MILTHLLDGVTFTSYVLGYIKISALRKLYSITYLLRLSVYKYTNAFC